MREVLLADTERGQAALALAAYDADSAVGDGETGCVLQVRSGLSSSATMISYNPGIRAFNTADVRSMNAARLMRSFYVGATRERKSVGRKVMPR